MNSAQNQAQPNPGQPLAKVPPPPTTADTSPMDRSYVPPKDEVAKRAYYLFLNQGGHNGYDLDHWLEAELQLFAEHNAALKKSRAQPAKK